LPETPPIPMDRPVYGPWRDRQAPGPRSEEASPGVQLSGDGRAVHWYWRRFRQDGICLKRCPRRHGIYGRIADGDRLDEAHPRDRLVRTAGYEEEAHGGREQGEDEHRQFETARVTIIVMQMLHGTTIAWAATWFPCGSSGADQPRHVGL